MNTNTISGWYRGLQLLPLLITLAVPAAFADEDRDYRLGQGFVFDALHLKLGGYLNLTASNLQGEDATLALRDLSLFATWRPSVRWTLFMEAEVEDSMLVDDRGLTGSDAELALERLYLEYTHRHWLSMRAGKFLTPVGRWNNVHAAPLVWSVSRPLVTELPFPSFATGLAASGSLLTDNGNLDYILYVDDSEDFDPANGETDFEGIELPGQSNDFEQAAGLQLRYHFLDERAEIGASYLHFNQFEHAEDSDLLGLDFFWTSAGYELSSELIYRFNEGSQSNEWGGFLQGVAPISHGIHVYGRYENYEAHSRAIDTRQRIIGLAWRPQPPVTLKLEWRDVDNERLSPGGWLASLAVLF